jgi:hypothetical protein
MNRHVFTEGCDFLGEFIVCSRAQPVDPKLKSIARCGKEPLPFDGLEFSSQSDRG